MDIRTFLTGRLRWRRCTHRLTPDSPNSLETVLQQEVVTITTTGDGSSEEREWVDVPTEETALVEA